MITFIGAGSVANAIGPVTPVAPAFSAGQQVIVFTGEFLGADTISAPGAPWVEITSPVQAPQLRAFGLDSTTGAETMPTFNWGATHRGWALAAVLSGVDPSFTSGFAAVDRVSTQAQNIVGPGSSRLPLVDGCFVALFGERNKTSTSNASSYSKPTGWTSLIGQLVLSGSSLSCAVSYLLQTAATTVAANQSMNGSVADGTNQSLQSSLFAIQPSIISTSTPTLALLGVGS